MSSKPDPATAITDVYHAVKGQTHVPGMCVSYFDPAYPTSQDGLVLPLGDAVLSTESAVALRTTADTVFELGSETKLFTSMKLAYPVALGYNSLSQTAASFLEAAYPFAGSTDFNAVTFLQLATHTSGMPDEAGGDASTNLFLDLPPSQDVQDFWNKFKSHDADRCWRYSSIGFVTLGFAATLLYGTARGLYNEILSTFFTGPGIGLLNMAHTGAVIQSGWSPAQGYYGPDNTIANGTAADLKSSGNDMLTFIRAQLGKLSPPPESPIAKAIALTQQQHGDYHICPSQKNPHPGMIKMGLGWQIPELDGRRALYKNGASGLGGQSCAIFLIPELSVGISVLTNQVYRKSAPRPAGTSPTDVARSILSTLHPETAALFDGVVEEPATDETDEA